MNNLETAAGIWIWWTVGVAAAVILMIAALICIGIIGKIREKIEEKRQNRREQDLAEAVAHERIRKLIRDESRGVVTPHSMIIWLNHVKVYLMIQNDSRLHPEICIRLCAEIDETIDGLKKSDKTEYWRT